MDTAYFVRRPRTVEDLRTPHPLDAERPYAIAGRVTLTAIEYENFITDLLADRQYIEAAAPLCASGAVMRCLLVTQGGGEDGVLVVPRASSFVGWAAYVPRAPGD